jgi:hypothetical protein
MATKYRDVHGALTQPKQRRGLSPTIWGWSPIVISDPHKAMVVINVEVILISNSLQVASEFGPIKINVKWKLLCNA